MGAHNLKSDPATAPGGESYRLPCVLKHCRIRETFVRFDIPGSYSVAFCFTHAMQLSALVDAYEARNKKQFQNWGQAVTWFLGTAASNG